MSLNEAVAKFLAEWPACQDPDLIHDRCHLVSEAFVALLAEGGIAAEVVGGFELGEVPGGGRLILRGHLAVLVDGTVYDWTARQFDPQAPVPLVIPYEKWRKTWQTI